MTGHSLGGGAAIVLALLLRSAYPQVHAFSFGTPGAVMDYDSCIDAKEFSTSIILGNDMICRTSLRSLNKLRNDILYAIARAKSNKMYILQSIIRELDYKDILYEKGQEPDSVFRKEFLKFQVSSVTTTTYSSF